MIQPKAAAAAQHHATHLLLSRLRHIRRMHPPDLFPWSIGVLLIVAGVLIPLGLAVARTRGLSLSVRGSRD